MTTLGISKRPTGVEGFDQITEGGLPCDRTTLVMGGPGAGKTIFALQFLVNGATQCEEPGIFVAFEENARQIIQNAATFGWNLAALEREKLFFLDAHIAIDAIQAGTFDLAGMLAALKAKAQSMGAKRIVFDSIDVLLSLLNNPTAERAELYRLREWLSESGMTGLLTAKSESADALRAIRYDFLQFMADCVVLLHHRLSETASVRSLRVMKYRGSSFAANEFPIAITSHGIEVGNHGSVTLDYPVFTERVATGVERLDTMLDGGYYRGSSVLISGAPGTAKSTLSAAFVAAACGRGEKSLYVSLDESAAQIIRNMKSVGIALDGFVQQGLLQMYSARSEAAPTEEHLIKLRDMVREFRPASVVIDPISAFTRAGDETVATDVTIRLIDTVKSLGITLVCTSLVNSDDKLADTSAAGISTIADTWIQLSYVVRAGERNRALSIIKSRGMQHSNQVRELILHHSGIHLTDVYAAGGEVLMGAARWEKEAADASARVAHRLAVERKRRDLQEMEAEALMQMQLLQSKLNASRTELNRLTDEDGAFQERTARNVSGLHKLRGADQDSEGPHDED